MQSRMIAMALLLLVSVHAPGIWAQASPLSIEDAVAMALEKDPSVKSSSWDWLSASAKAEAAGWRMLPSLSFAAGYQKLSDLPPASLEIANPFAPAGPPLDFSFPPSLTNLYSFSLNMQYPVFAGFRIREAAALAQLQAQGKRMTLEMVKRSLVFEVRRAYWEAVRATNNVQTLQKNLELMKVNSELAARQVSQGIATRADQLAADTRYIQADLDLGDAVSLQKRSYLVLASLVGTAADTLTLSADPMDGELPFTLATHPEDRVPPVVGETLDENALISAAMERRPETRSSAISLQLAQHNVSLAQAGLYPTLTLTGNYTLADPNSRVPFQSDPAAFTGTWSLGVQLSYDISGIPAGLAESDAQSQAVRKAESDAQKQANTVVLDVKTCILNLQRARRDLALIRGMIEQSRENVRVTQQRLEAGTANTLDVLTAQFNLLRAGFSVTNKEIDAQIASADLARAISLDEIE